MNSIIWDEEHTVKLINEYKRQNVLWNPDNRGYQHRNARNDAWLTIAKSMNLDMRDIKRKMNSLIAVFRSQHRKGVPNPRWWAGHMSFLLYIGGNKPDDSHHQQSKIAVTASFALSDDNSVGSISDDHDDQVASECEFLDSSEPQKRPFQSAFQEFRAEYETETPPPKRGPKGLNESNNIINDDNLSDFEEFSVPPKETSNDINDDMALYVQYLGCKMAKYSPRTRSVIQFKFNRILYEADMGTLDKKQEASSS